MWRLALARALAEHRSCDHDEDVQTYLDSRGLGAARGNGGLGILATDIALPQAVRSWPTRGYRIVVPLYHVPTAELINVQARSINAEARPKTLLPRASKSRRTVFANAAGLAVLRDAVAEPRPASPWSKHPDVVLAEGLTDFLALSLHLDIPVLAVPGASLAPSAVWHWARGRTVILALDHDQAGNNAAQEVARAAEAFAARELLRVVWPAPAKDACDSLKQLGEQRFSDLLAAVVHRAIQGEGK